VGAKSTNQFHISRFLELALDERTEFWMFLPREQSWTGSETEL
jgi:hypothetical protein